MDNSYVDFAKNPWYFLKFFISRRIHVFKLWFYRVFDDFMHMEVFLPFDLVKWLWYDLVFETKNDNAQLFGFFMFCGLPGEGKTLSLARRLSFLRAKYGNSIYIITNFRWKYEDREFKSWRELLNSYDKPLVVGFDEIQNEFQSRDFGAFPKELIGAITQFRKGNGIAVYATTQVFTNVDTIIRSQCKEVVHCRKRVNRLIINRHYEPTQYELWQSSKGSDSQIKVKLDKLSMFVATNRLRNQYSTHQFLESAMVRMGISKSDGGGGEAAAPAT